MVWSRQTASYTRIRKVRGNNIWSKKGRNQECTWAVSTPKEKKKEASEIEEESIANIEADEHFAFIVGYTSKGAAYGLTHEEYERLDDDFTGTFVEDEFDGGFEYNDSWFEYNDSWFEYDDC